MKNGIEKKLKNKPVSKFASFVFLSLLIFQGLANAEVLMVPKELYDYSLENNCAQVSDYYRKKFNISKPPYVYGVRGQYDFGIVWCEQKKENNDKNYILLLKLNGYKWPGGCPEKIENLRYPAGLSVSWNTNEPLNWYREVNNPNVQGPPDLMTNGPIIESNNDGVADHFYCHKKKWLMRTSH